MRVIIAFSLFSFFHGPQYRGARTVWTVFCFTIAPVLNFRVQFFVHALRRMWQNISRVCKHVEQIFIPNTTGMNPRLEAGDALTVRPSRSWFVNGHRIAHYTVRDELMFQCITTSPSQQPQPLVLSSSSAAIHRSSYQPSQPTPSTTQDQI
jgi:hypothetical protein